MGRQKFFINFFFKSVNFFLFKFRRPFKKSKGGLTYGINPFWRQFYFIFGAGIFQAKLFLMGLTPFPKNFRFFFNYSKNFLSLDGYVSTESRVDYYRGEASSKFSAKSRINYYRGDINKIFLCCRYRKVAVGHRGEMFLNLCQKSGAGCFQWRRRKSRRRRKKKRTDPGS